MLSGVDPPAVLLFCSNMIVSENRHPSIEACPEDLPFGIKL